jgi:RNA polymerase sigma-70 factor (ECF subfamily)
MRFALHKRTAYLPENESMLLNQLIEGCPLAFKAIYNFFQPRLQLFIYPFTGHSKDLSNEIIQDVFIKLWMKRKGLSEVKSLECYLQRMARNHLIDYARLHKIKLKHEQAFASSQQSALIIPEEELMLREYHKITQEAIKLLPERRSSVFKLNVMEGHSLDEVSAMTGLSKEVVKKQLFKAKKFILEYLKVKAGIDIPAVAILLLLSVSFP